jgi:hypothetical protein
MASTSRISGAVMLALPKKIFVRCSVESASYGFYTKNATILSSMDLVINFFVT